MYIFIFNFAFIDSTILYYYDYKGCQIDLRNVSISQTKGLIIPENTMTLGMRVENN